MLKCRILGHYDRHLMLPSLPENDAEGAETPRKRKERVLKRWEAYWDKCSDVQVPERNAVFRVYEAGGGEEDVPHLFLIHGGGYTALTWSLMASKMKNRFRLSALDMRGHGCSTSENDADLSADTLTEDVVAVWHKLRPENDTAKHSVIVVGHSMGGAIAVRAAATGRIASLGGVAVIDVVEGTAIASLPYMKNIINKRPPSFANLESAIGWALSTKMCRREESACISVPSMLLKSDGQWTWRTPLLLSEPYWSGWYEGLSELFLSLPVPKLLCLAGTDRLDRTLTVGQMQGKFQLSLLPTAGHAIHEDDSSHVAELLTTFIEKFRIGQAPLPFLRPN